jgi:hypothetical protein
MAKICCFVEQYHWNNQPQATQKNVVEVFAIAMVSARRIISARGPASIVAANWRSPQTSAFRSQISPIP